MGSWNTSKNMYCFSTELCTLYLRGASPSGLLPGPSHLERPAKCWNIFVKMPKPGFPKVDLRERHSNMPRWIIKTWPARRDQLPHPFAKSGHSSRATTWHWSVTRSQLSSEVSLRLRSFPAREASFSRMSSNKIWATFHGAPKPAMTPFYLMILIFKIDISYLFTIIPQIALAIGVLTSNRGWGRWTTLAAWTWH